MLDDRELSSPGAARCFRPPAQVARESVDCELNGQGTKQNGLAGVRQVTAAQLPAIHAIASRQSLDLVENLRKRFGLYRAEDLTLEQASQLIEAMKTPTNGAVNQQQ